jgi:CRISPR-associated endonuclease/helicase Cas3
MDTKDNSGRGLTLLWAKLSKKDTTPRSYHPLICHLIDVAAVTAVMWEQMLSRWTRGRVAEALGLDVAAAGTWIAFWSGSHDVGKACPAFQVRHETPLELRDRIKAALPVPDQFNKVNHGAVSTFTLRETLQTDYRVPRVVAGHLATSIGGHHGTFPGPDDLRKLAPGGIHGGPLWAEAQRSLLRDLAQLVGVPQQQIPTQIDVATAMWLAGLVSVADWIGSNEDYFHHKALDLTTPPTIDAASYLIEAQATARESLQRLGWRGAGERLQPRSFAALFPSIQEPAPVQRAVVALTQERDEPGLAIVEAPMGEGKSEAALYLAEHWDASLGQHGCYFALPSQATSNQMFSRVRQFLMQCYAGDTRADEVVTLQLLHGHAALSAEFQALLHSGNKLFAPANIHDDAPHAADRPDVVAGEWFTHRKRGLLSPFGVGTVDQALLAVLSTRHVFVRLFGLAGKTVIVDEVHAYDTYMSELLEQLLRWLGALGCSVVLLSATLPTQRRERLAHAYREGAAAGITPAHPADEARADSALTVPYPRITWAPATARQPIVVRHVMTSERSCKTIRLERIDGRLSASPGMPFVLGEQLQRALADGGCAAIICNTVRRARQVYRALKQYFPDVAEDGTPQLDLLHARYPFEERDRREKRALVRFGKPGGIVETEDGSVPVHRPDRAVLISTQIIEQSLDLDFDLMVTELAPVDLVLQRSGRLWRHERKKATGKVDRPKGFMGPTLWLCEPEMTADGVPKFGSSSYVYDPHVLLCSWHELNKRVPPGTTATLRVPEHIEELIEAVYAETDTCPHDMPEAWRTCWEETRTKQQDAIKEERAQAKQRYIKAPGYKMGKGVLDEIAGRAREEDAPQLHPALQAVTRLAEPNVSVILLYDTQGKICLDPEGREPVPLARTPDVPTTVRLLERSLSLSGYEVVERVTQREAPQAWQRSTLLRNHRAVILNAQGHATEGDLTLQLDPDEGLIVCKAGKEVS